MRLPLFVTPKEGERSWTAERRQKVETAVSTSLIFERALLIP